MNITVKLVIALGICIGGLAEAKTVRATDMTSTLWSNVLRGSGDDFTIEFRQGDNIPVILAAEGDFLETSQVGTSYVLVKKGFWLQLQNHILQASLDGVNFKPLGDLASGSFTANGWTGSGPINALNLALQAYAK